MGRRGRRSLHGLAARGRSVLDTCDLANALHVLFCTAWTSGSTLSRVPRAAQLCAAGGTAPRACLRATLCVYCCCCIWQGSWWLEAHQLFLPNSEASRALRLCHGGPLALGLAESASRHLRLHRVALWRRSVNADLRCDPRHRRGHGADWVALATTRHADNSSLGRHLMGDNYCRGPSGCGLVQHAVAAAAHHLRRHVQASP
mmetsp:Transcript_149445/g.272040  ORF Transcript_149445/g.272040 Transcript_149445/m.272040 type:complete len:202 (-) Transcript_149445:534-1139(-)